MSLLSAPPPETVVSTALPSSATALSNTLNPAVVFSVGSGMNGLGIVRSLARRGIEVHLVCLGGKYNLASQSRYCTEVHAIDDDSAATVVAKLKSIAVRMKLPPVLFCDSDESTHLAAVSVAQLEPHFIFTVPLREILQLQDKEYQARQAAAAGTAVPQSWFLNSWEDLKVVKPAPGRKLIVKPNPSVFTSSAPFKIFFASDAADVEKKLRTFVATPAGMIVQEFVEGGDENMWAAIGFRPDNGRPASILTFIKTMQSGTGSGGVAVIGCATRNEQLENTCIRLLEQLNYVGLFANEYKYCDTQKQFVFIEANYRTARCHVIGRKCGLDLPAIAYSEVTGHHEVWQKPANPGLPLWWYDMRSVLEIMTKTRNAKKMAGIIKELMLIPFRRTEWGTFAGDDWAPSRAVWKDMWRDYSERLGRLFGKR